MPTICVRDREDSVRVDGALVVNLWHVITDAFTALAGATRSIEIFEIVPIIQENGDQAVLLKFIFESDVFPGESISERQEIYEFICSPNFDRYMVGFIIEIVHRRLETQLNDDGDGPFMVKKMFAEADHALEEHNSFIAKLLEDPRFRVENMSASEVSELPSCCPSCRNGSVQLIGPAFKCEFCNSRFVLEPSLGNSNGNGE
jgi:hypothetical protein